MDEVVDIKDSEGYGEDNSLCPICFVIKRNVIYLPCKHLFCNKSIDKIMIKKKCPLWRGAIIIVYKIQIKIK